MLAQLPARAACRRIGRRSSARRAFLTLPDMYRSVISSDLAGVDVDRVAKAAIPLQDLRRDDFALVRQAIGQARVVLMGEETHGTEEFYQLRSDLTKALIDREGFTAVLCEGTFLVAPHAALVLTIARSRFPRVLRAEPVRGRRPAVPRPT